MRYHARQKPLERTCKQCNQPFTIWASLILWHGKAGEYCSKQCFLDASRVTVICDKCGIEFSRQRKTASRYSGGKNYCSRECCNLARRKNPNKIAIKRLRYGSSEFRKARKAIIERDGTCRICDNGLANSIHHADWNPYNNDLDNLVLLCKSCHGSVRRLEDWRITKDRIMACSVLHGNMQSSAEMTELNSL